ncbi:MAG: rhomboid family intramembrane serine protease [Pseudomonadota bacterium]
MSKPPKGIDISDSRRSAHLGPFAPVVIGITAICVAIEAIMQLGDAGLLPPPRFRSVVYEFGGFWPGLLTDWGSNYPFQSVAMFVTYAFLHAGFWHLALNMITLWSLAAPILLRVGQVKFSVLYALSILGGGAGYALLSDTFRPMVGASGALFGLAGAILAWEYIDRFAFRRGVWPVAQAALLLILLNAALYFAMGGVLAWETHLGGFIAGWIAALLVDPRSRAPQAD